MEMVVTVALVAMMIGISVMAMKGGDSKVSTIGLAAAVSDEFRAARLLAISNGYPVAVGLPTKGGSNEVADSLYRLEGWNVPLVTWSVGYGGDYPRLGFSSCQWSPAAGNFTTTMAAPPLSKIADFDWTTWVPAKHQTDSLFIYLPDGSLVTNGRPALDGRYTVVIAKDPVVDGGKITAGQDPVVVYLSPGGAVEYSKQLPGKQLTGGGAQAHAPVKKRDTPPTGTAKVQISEIQVRPGADDKATSGNDAYCIPGQQITFELYAYDPEGRDLFCQWTQKAAASGLVGNFTVPVSTQGPLTSETERMNWVEKAPSGLNWLGSQGAPPGGCFRARWTWTVPVNSKVGDVYEVQADVKDAKGDAQIENRPPAMRLRGAPAGKLLVQLQVGGRSVMMRMNPDGSGQQVLTPMGMEELMPSASGDGTKVAFIQGPPGNQNGRYIKVRSLTGGGEYTVAGPAWFSSVSISPDGGWISYRNNATNKLIFRRLGKPLPGVAFTKDQAWSGSTLPEPRSRTGWSKDGKWAVWGNEWDIKATNLASGADNTIFTYGLNTLGQHERCFAPTCFTPPGGGGERVCFTVGNFNPVLGHIPFNPTGSMTGSFNDGTVTLPDLDGGGGDAGSGSYDDGLPNISVDGRFLVLPRYDRPTATQSALIVEWTGSNFVFTGSAQSINRKILSVVWLP